MSEQTYRTLTLRGREGLAPYRCSHASPVLVEPAGNVCHARCLVCNTLGPKQETSVRAYEALRSLSKSKGERSSLKHRPPGFREDS
jgi:hypothetical protein